MGKGFDMKCRFFCNVADVCETNLGRKEESKMMYEIKRERRKVNDEKIQEAYEEKKKENARSFDADEFLKKKYKTMKEFRQDHPHLYKEEKEDKRYKFNKDKPDYEGELD